MSANLNDNAGVLLEGGTNVPPSAAAAAHARAQAGVSALNIISCVVLVAGLAFLGWLSFGLASMRIYQVDECCNVWAAHLIAVGKSLPGMDLFQLILSWIMPAAGRAADFFASARELSLMIFWLNWLLLAMATGEKILSRRWLVALVLAATLAPLWDYGFEARHDNLLLAGVLLMWGVVRFQPPRLGAFFFVGACFVGLEFVSIKAIFFTFPISVAVLAFPRPGACRPAWKRFAAWCVGALVAFFVLRLIFKFAGLSHDYLANVKGVAAVPSEALRFWPFDITLSRLFIQTPLLVAVTVAAVIVCGATLIRERRAALNWDGILPETLLFGVAFAALFVNPNPYPYNLLHLVPYAFLLAFRYGAIAWKQIPQQSAFAPLAISVVAFAHLVPFGVQTHRHWAMSNFRQEQVMGLTEDLTDPVKDTYFDGIGMVPSRSCDLHAFIHGQILKSLVDGSGPHIRDMLAANPPSVVILSYRTDWLPDEDQDFLRERYVPMADDFMVLGALLPEGGGTFQVYHAGRYRITSGEGSNIIGTYEPPKTMKEALAPLKPVPPLSGTVDGVPLNGKPVELSVGAHRIECPSGEKAAVVWVGPHADEIPRMPGESRHRLFVNWY